MKKVKSLLNMVHDNQTPQLKAAILILSELKPNLCLEAFKQAELIESAKNLRTVELDVLRHLYGSNNAEFQNELFDQEKQAIFDDNSISNAELEELDELHKAVSNYTSKYQKRYTKNKMVFLTL